MGGGGALAALMGLLGAIFALAGGGGGSGGATSAPEPGPESGPEPADDDPQAASPPAAPQQAFEDVTPEPVIAEDPAPAQAPTPAPMAPLPESLTPDLPDSAYDIGWGGLSDEEQLIVELVNRARLDPSGELGRQEDGFAAGVSTAPKQAVAVVETLSDAADGHSQDMDARNFFAHTNPEGQAPWDRAVEAGHENQFVGENIGWAGSTGALGDPQVRAQSHHDSLWESDGHQQNFMNSDWSEVGVGYDYGDHVYEGVNYTASTFVTQKFGDTGKTYLTGTVIDDADGDAFYDIGEGQGGVRITAWNDEGVFATATWGSGGYTLELPPGTYRVAFEGGELDGSYETEVTIGSENVKLDVIEERDAVGAVQAATPADPTLQLVVSPAPPPDPTAEALAHLLSGVDTGAEPATLEALAEAQLAEHEDDALLES